tara:strand:+ start:302 stop:469 length:168 start_codon:yes stop_codon:yes gene_type:complete
MRRVCDLCHGNGYVAIDVADNGKGPVYGDCPKCHCEGELEDGLMEAHQAQRELGE